MLGALLVVSTELNWSEVGSVPDPMPAAALQFVQGGHNHPGSQRPQVLPQFCPSFEVPFSADHCPVLLMRDLVKV